MFARRSNRSLDRRWSTWRALIVGLLVAFASPDGGVGAALAGDSTEFPSWFKQSFLDLRQDLLEAGRAGKHGIMILFSIRGCAYCKMMVDRSIKDPGIEAALRGHFDVVHLDIHSQLELKDPLGRAMPVSTFASLEGASFSPSVAFYGLDGTHLLRVVGYQTPERFRATLAKVEEMLDRRRRAPLNR